HDVYMLSRTKKMLISRLAAIILDGVNKITICVTTRKIEYALQDQTRWRLVLRGLFHQCGAGRLRRCSSGGFYLPSKRERGSWDCCGNAVSPATCINRGWSSALGLPWLIEASSRDAPSDRENVSGLSA